MPNLTREEATAQGFKIDTTVYPHFGYKGPRFNPTHSCNVYTPLEAELIEQKKVLKLNADRYLVLRDSEDDLPLSVHEALCEGGELLDYAVDQLKGQQNG